MGTSPDESGSISKHCARSTRRMCLCCVCTGGPGEVSGESLCCLCAGGPDDVSGESHNDAGMSRLPDAEAAGR